MAARARLVPQKRRRLSAGVEDARGNVREQASQIRRDVSLQLRKLLEDRSLTTVFQPIFGFIEGRILGFEALVRGPEGSLIQTPLELFTAAAEAGVAVELNLLCIQEILRAFAGRKLQGSLFLNISPQLILQRGFERERAERFLRSLGLAPERVVIELTEDYPTVDFRLVHESLMLYRSMGFRVAIDDLGEGFASLRLWSELKPEFVKADKHFVTGIAGDPVKMQFLRAIQQIAENSGSQVIAEGIENAADFKVVKDLGVACGQGWFIGRPAEFPDASVSAEAERAQADTRMAVVPSARLRAGSEPTAHDFVRAVECAAAHAPLGALLERFAASPALAAIPVMGAAGLEGVVSRSCVDLVAACGRQEELRSRPCIELADRAPIHVEADLELAALTAILVESDSRRLADGFVIVSRGRYLGMGTSADVMRSLQGSRVLAARYTNPLTLLPGQVPINEHLERLLARKVPFTAWFAEVGQMRGLNDSQGFARGDALIHAAARLLESACETGVDFAGHVSGSRFVVLMQSEDWQARAAKVLEEFPAIVAAHVPAQPLARGYFTTRRRDGRENVRPLPKLVIGILPVLPGVFESRHEVVGVAKRAAEMALAQTGNAIYVDHHHANAYPQSLLFDSP
jgi:EAL domain-containing protein (putative c-di-GMP-specific phosphodiesterase class I)/GGDEF domain-containing protein